MLNHTLLSVSGSISGCGLKFKEKKLKSKKLTKN